jgi:putative oxidoreductase
LLIAAVSFAAIARSVKNRERLNEDRYCAGDHDANIVAPSSVRKTTDMTTDQYRESRAEAPAGLTALVDSPRLDQVYAPYGIFLLRVAIGIDWIAHALLKTYRGMYTHEALLAKNGIASLLAWPTFSIELIGGCAILLGWYTRQWSAILLVFLAVVVWIKWPVGWLYSNPGGGWEYPLLWLMAQAALMLAGGGAFALQARR